MPENFFTPYLPFLFLVTGLALVIISVFYKSEKSKLKLTGILAEGIVLEKETSIHFSYSSDNGNASAKDKVIVRFITQKEEWITGAIQQDFQIFYTGQYKDGDKVTVYYHPDNPNHFYVDTKQSELTGRIVISLAGLVFLLIGLYKLLV